MVRSAPTSVAVASGRSITSETAISRAPARRAAITVRQPLANHEAAVPAFEVVMKVGAADPAGAEAYQHLPRPDLRVFGRFDTKVFLGMNAACKHVLSRSNVERPSRC